MTEEEQRERVIRYVRRRMAELSWDDRRLEVETGVDRKTLRSFFGGERSPNLSTRTAIENALALPHGTLDGVRGGYIQDDPEPTPVTDPVERAIYESSLTRANQLKLAGLYYEMLDEQAGRTGT